MTIGQRLTIWNSVTIAAVTMVMAVAVYFLTSLNLDRTVDQDLLKRTDRFKRIWSASEGAGTTDIVRPEGGFQSHEHSRFEDTRRKEMEAEMEFTVPRLSGSPGWNDLRSRPFWDPAMAERSTSNGGPTLSTVWAADSSGTMRHIRVATVHLKGSGREATAQFAEPLTAVDSEKKRLAALLLVLVPVGWALAVAAGWLLTKRSLLPVQRIIAAAGELHPSQTGRRLPEDGTDEMSQLATTINRFLDQSEQSYHRLETFVADASHELKSPLTAILLRASSREAGPEMEAVRRSALAMRNTVEDLLLVARMDQQSSFERSDVDLGRVAGEIADDYVESLGERLVTHIEPGVIAQGSPLLLRRVVANLIENARNHAGPDATIRLKVSAEDGFAVVSVADDGVGIPPEHLGKVFDRFYRADQARTHDEDWVGGGSGLGLSIVQSIAKLHGGTVTLTSEVCQGTEVVVKVPESSGR